MTYYNICGRLFKLTGDNATYDMNRRKEFEKELEKKRTDHIWDPVNIEKYRVSEFLEKFAKPVQDSKGNVVYIEDKDGNKTDKVSYLGSTKLEDLRYNPDDHIGVAYDPKTDRPPVWMTSGKRTVGSYKKNILKDAHVQQIVLVDIKENIKSFERLIDQKNDKDFVRFDKFKDEISNEIKYWKGFLDKGFSHLVLCGKNRSIFAIPHIYQNWVKERKLDKLDPTLPLRVEVKYNYVTEEHKGHIYNNEKANHPDTDYQKIMGYNSRMNDFVHEYTDFKYKDLFRNTLTETELASSYDKHKILSILAIDQDKYGSLYSWANEEFLEDAPVKKSGRRLTTQVCEYFKRLHERQTIESEWSRFKGDKMGKSWWQIIAYLFQDFNKDGYEINLPTETERIDALIDASLTARMNLDKENQVYAKGVHGAELRPKDLRSGMKNMSCTYKKGMVPLTEDERENGIDESLQEVGSQSIVYKFIQYQETKKILEDRGILIKPTSREFSLEEINEIVQRDKQGSLHWLRINGTIITEKGNEERFSDKFPDDEFIQKHGPNKDYVLVPMGVIMGSKCQVDHIPPYSKNKDKKDLNTCEMTTARFNNFKDNRKLKDEKEVISNIRSRKQNMDN